MDKIKKVYEYLNNLLNGQSRKKVVENALIVVIIGIIIIIAGGSFMGKGKAKNDAPLISDKNAAEATTKNTALEDNSDNEKKIEALLSQIEGAGKVSIIITYSSGKEIVPAVDTKKTENDTQEKDNGGGTRSINQNDLENKIVYEESQGGGKKPIIIKEIQPEVKGVVVVADGAADSVVKESLCRAVQVLLDVPIHKIQVFERKK